MSFPHNLVLDSKHKSLKILYNFLINWLIFMKFVANEQLSLIFLLKYLQV